MARRGFIAAAVLSSALVSSGHRAVANDSIDFAGGPMKNLYIDLVFWGNNFCQSGNSFCQPGQQDDRTTIMQYVTNLMNWLNGGVGEDGSGPPPGVEPAIHYYGLSGIYPGMWLNDPMAIPATYMACTGSNPSNCGTSNLGDGQFRPIIPLAQNGTLGPAFDYNNNVADWSGIPASPNRLTLIITKGTNGYNINGEGANGYHDTLNGNPFGAVEFESRTPVLSHEIMEAMSDPIRLQGTQPFGDNGTGWYAQTGDFSTNELADECQSASNGTYLNGTRYVNGTNYSWITVDSLYSLDGVSTPWGSCGMTIPEQHAPLAATFEYGVNGQQPLNVFYVDTNGHVQALQWDYAGQPLTTGPYDYGQPSPTVRAVGKPSAVYNLYAGGEYVFVKGSDGGVWMINGGTWTPLYGVIFGDPMAVMWNWNDATWITVAGLGTDDHLYIQHVLNGVPQGWGQVPTGSVLFSGSPNISSQGPNSLDLFAVGEDGQMKQIQYTQAGGWTQAATVDSQTQYNPYDYYPYLVSQPFVTTPAVAALSSGSLEVIGGYAPWEDDSGMYLANWTSLNLWLTWNRDSYSWMTWVTPFFDAMEQSLGMYSLQGTPSIVSSGNGRVDAFAVSRGGELWWFYSTDETTWYSETLNGGSVVMNPPGSPDEGSPASVYPVVRGGVTGDPLAVSRSPNEVEVFYRTQLGGLSHIMFNESANTWTSEIVLKSALGSGIIYDPPTLGGSATQCFAGGTWMHCCPSGYVMVGADVNDNMFKCAPLTIPAPSPTGFSGPWVNSMHSCPYGQVMAGLRADQGILACVPLSVVVPDERIDSSTIDAQQPTIHACDAGTPTGAMSGLDLTNLLLNCAATAQVQ